jgi:hypothetical protein
MCLKRKLKTVGDSGENMIDEELTLTPEDIDNATNSKIIKMTDNFVREYINCMNSDIRSRKNAGISLLYLMSAIFVNFDQKQRKKAMNTLLKVVDDFERNVKNKGFEAYARKMGKT